jgi:hypothetical protein
MRVRQVVGRRVWLELVGARRHSRHRHCDTVYMRALGVAGAEAALGKSGLMFGDQPEASATAGREIGRAVAAPLGIGDANRPFPSGAPDQP